MTWGQSITISKPSDTPVECSFANLQLLLLEISFQDPEPNPELRVPNPFCLMQMTDWVRPADSFTSISIPSDGLISFAQFTEFFNLGCGLIVGNDDFLADEPNEDQFKFEYNPGLFGSRNRVNVSARFRFFNVDYFEDFDEMPIPILFDTRLENFGPAEFTLRLPPEILESSINSNSDPDFKEVKWGDSITVSTNGTSETKKVLMWIRLPELDQWCWHTLVDVDDLDSELASEKTYVVPSREFFQDHCNSQINPANGLQINPELDRYVTIQYLNIYDQGQETSFILEGVSTPTPSPVLEPAPTPQPKFGPTPEPEPTPAPQPVPFLQSATPPQIRRVENALICTPGTYISGTSLAGVVQTSTIAAYTPTSYQFTPQINGVANSLLAITSPSTSASWLASLFSPSSLVTCSVTVTMGSLSNTSMSTENNTALSGHIATKDQAIASALASYSNELSSNEKEYQQALVESRIRWRSEIDANRQSYLSELEKINTLPQNRTTRALKSEALRKYIATQKSLNVQYKARGPEALASKTAANTLALEKKNVAISEAESTYAKAIETMGYGVLIS